MIVSTTQRTNALRQIATTHLPTRWGIFRVLAFERETSNGQLETALAIVMGEVDNNLAHQPLLLRIHSQCLTGEVLGSLRCDCKDQLEIAMQAIAGEGRGLVIYEHQEGRGIGLMAKLNAYALQDTGLDTIEANHRLGLKADYRDFRLPVAILAHLGVNRVRLLSNNPQKAEALLEAGIEVVAQIPCEANPNPHSLPYLRAKKEKMGHTLSLVESESPQDFMSRSQDQHSDFQFATIDEAIGELKAGRMIVVVDDEDRENEGDLTMAAEMITPEAINFMATHGRGLICLAMTPERISELDLPPMATENTAVGGTAFTVSIDLIGGGVTTGISAKDRAETIRAAIDPSSDPADFGRPGHVFPLCARPGGVLERRGQTEASVDLASLADLYPAGVICEVINDDGTMARVPDLIRFCSNHNLLMITVADLARYRLEMDYEWLLAAYGFSSTYPFGGRDTNDSLVQVISSSTASRSAVHD
jgi:3,4-dihydroxy-2-butanone 4-phosphate synthase/GTP cyclohydrolase II